MVYGLYVLSPGKRPFLPPLLHGPYQQRSARVAAPGPHDFAVRCQRFAGCTSHLTPAAAIATRTTFRDDRETSLTVARAGRVVPQIRISVKRNIFDFRA